MPDENIDVAPDSATEPEATPPILGDAGKKALAEEREARKQAERAAQQAAAQLDAFQKQIAEATAAREEADTKAATAAVEALRYRMAVENQIPADAVTLLTGSDEETLAAQVKQILALAGNSSSTLPPDPTQGAKGTPPKASTADMFASAFADRF